MLILCELNATKQERCPTGKRHCRQKPCLMAPIDIQHAPLSHICQHPSAPSESCSSSARTSTLYPHRPHQDRKRLTGSLLRSSRAECQRQGETCQPWRQTQPQTPVDRGGGAVLSTVTFTSSGTDAGAYTGSRLTQGPGTHRRRLGPGICALSAVGDSAPLFRAHVPQPQIVETCVSASNSPALARVQCMLVTATPAPASYRTLVLLVVATSKPA